MCVSTMDPLVGVDWVVIGVTEASEADLSERNESKKNVPSKFIHRCLS